MGDPRNNKKAPCPLCGGEKTDGFTTFTVDLDFGVVVVRKVPARVCSQCGERWIGNQAAQGLEEIVNEARAKRNEVAIVHYAA